MSEVAEKATPCFDLRGSDPETLLLGAVTGSIIDAARLVREEWRNGFPNWAMYRTAYAGDTHLALNLRAWCEAFGVAYIATCGATKGGERLGWAVGRDAFVMLTTTRWGAPAEEIAPLLGVTAKTYRLHRRALAARLTVALQEYFMRLGIAMRQVALLERRQESPRPFAGLTDGRGFGDLAPSGDGNYRAFPRGSGC